MTNESDNASAQRLHFIVRDTGIGIPHDKQKRVFDAFAQADTSMARKFGGTGLGLAISSRLVQMLGGRMWLESEEGVGSSFHFTSLVEQPASQARGQAEIPDLTDPIRDAAVLVVEHHETTRRVLVELLSSWGMVVTAAATVERARVALGEAAEARRPFRILLANSATPGVHAITNSEQFAGPASVILMEQWSSRLDTPSSAKQSNRRTIKKPIRRRELHAIISEALQSGGARGLTSNAIAVPVPATESQKPLRILVAEDNLVNQLLAKKLLERRGHAVTIASNGREATDIVAQAPFDVVLMDVQMPEMDGFEATASIRALEMHTGRHLPIIAMTANALSGDEDRCLEAGMDFYVAKPVQPAHLFKTIERAVQSSSRPSARVD